MGQSVLNEDFRQEIRSIMAQTQAITLNSGAKVTENLLSRMTELDITVNGEPREEVEEVTHPFIAEVMAIPIPDKFKLPTMPLTFDYTLSDLAKNWYSKLKPNFIGSWNDLKKAFRD
ncbi:hypothetical protein TIFTF001_026757 [Ficus carica]|uniref:Retrotransposon gag domain-containing protein n=1 Tax=Ficus carica TaxID=3494 RepID=A0AA88IZ63_FICCA|nr:hypothetical protein TIFTF001_026757 [Ficus carica]